MQNGYFYPQICIFHSNHYHFNLSIPVTFQKAMIICRTVLLLSHCCNHLIKLLFLMLDVIWNGIYCVSVLHLFNCTIPAYWWQWFITTAVGKNKEYKLEQWGTPLTELKKTIVSNYWRQSQVSSWGRCSELNLHLYGQMEKHKHSIFICHCDSFIFNFASWTLGLFFCLLFCTYLPFVAVAHLLPITAIVYINSIFTRSSLLLLFFPNLTSLSFTTTHLTFYLCLRELPV